MTSDLVNLINQTKKDVESLRAFRRNSKNGSKASSKKNTYASPVGDRNRDDAYGLKEKVINSEKREGNKNKKKLFPAGSNSNRKNKVKSKQANYQPVSGKIDLVSRNDRSVTQIRNENNSKPSSSSWTILISRNSWKG